MGELAREGAPERGGERFVLRRTPKGYKIHRLVDQIDFPGEPFWVDTGAIWRGRTREAATEFMRSGRHRRASAPQEDRDPTCPPAGQAPDGVLHGTQQRSER